MSRDALVNSLKRFAEWPGLVWLAPVLLGIGSFVGVALYKAYVADPLTAVDTKIDGVVARMDRKDERDERLAADIHKMTGQVDVLVRDRRANNAFYESRQEPQIYGIGVK